MSDWTLHRGDCIAGLQTLADKSVDVTITDPPYEAEAHTLMRRQKGKATQPGGGDQFRAVLDASLTFAPMTADLRAAIGLEIARISRLRALVFCQIEAVTEWRRALEAGGMKYRRTIPWIKPDAMPSLHGRWPGQSFEAIVLATHPGADACPIGGKALTYTFTRELGKAPHPTTKPQTLMRALVTDFSEPGELVLDPFAGSGSTGVACGMLGRRFIGWELDAAYYEIARRRLSGEEAKPRLEQPSLFGGSL